MDFPLPFISPYSCLNGLKFIFSFKDSASCNMLLFLNKPLASEAFFRLSVSPSPSPWALIDVSSRFYVWHLKKQLKRIASICKRKTTFLKDKTSFSLGGIQTPRKMVFATIFSKVDRVHVCMYVCVCVGSFACRVYMFEHASMFASCVMFNFACP